MFSSLPLSLSLSLLLFIPPVLVHALPPAFTTDTSPLFFFNMSVPEIVGYLPVDTLPQCSSQESSLTGGVEFFSYLLFLEDCADGYQLCMAQNANIPLGELITSVTRIPNGLRRFVDTTFILETSSSDSYTSSQDLIMYGKPTDADFIHTATIAALSGNSNYGPSSSSWQSAVDSDSCVVSDWATEGYEEAMGEAAVLVVFELLNGFWANGWNQTCMQNQINYLKGLSMFSSQADLFKSSCAQDLSASYVDAINTAAPISTLTSWSVREGGFTATTVASTATPTDTVDNQLTAIPSGYTVVQAVTLLGASSSSSSTAAVAPSSSSAAAGSSSSSSAGSSTSSTNGSGSSSSATSKASSGSSSNANLGSSGSTTGTSNSESQYSTATNQMTTISSPQGGTTQYVAQAVKTSNSETYTVSYSVVEGRYDLATSSATRAVGMWREGLLRAVAMMVVVGVLWR